MISAYTGRVGSGKSYAAVMKIIEMLKNGRVVATNIELKFPEVAALVLRRFELVLDPRQFIYLEESKVKEFYKHIPPGASFVCDEAHIYFNSRDWASCGRELLLFLSQSRKVGVDCIFISQHENNIDKQFLRLAAEIWRFRDMRNFRPFGVKIPLPMFTAAQYDSDGKTLLNFYYRGIDAEIFKCYDSFALLVTFPMLTAVSVTVKKQKRKKTTMKIIIFLLVVVIGIGAAFFHFSDRWGGAGAKGSAAAAMGDSLKSAAGVQAAPIVGPRAAPVEMDRGRWTWSYVASSGRAYTSDGDVIKAGDTLSGARVEFVSADHLLLKLPGGLLREISQDAPRNFMDKPGARFVAPAVASMGGDALRMMRGEL